MRSRCTAGSIPSIRASVARRPGPAPNITRPMVMWSSWMIRLATISGLWYGSDTTPVPKRIRLVRSAAAAMNSSGELMVSMPAEWCSPIHASSNPKPSSSSISSMSRAKQRVGFSVMPWNGARKTPWRRLVVMCRASGS